MVRILIVEDDESVAGMLLEILEEMIPGCEVLWASSLEQAFEHYDTYDDFKVMLLDGWLGKSTTIEFADKVARDGFGGLLVAMSSDLSEELIDAGCNERLRKPFGISDLRMLLGAYPHLIGSLRE